MACTQSLSALPPSGRRRFSLRERTRPSLALLLLLVTSDLVIAKNQGDDASSVSELEKLEAGLLKLREESASRSKSPSKAIDVSLQHRERTAAASPNARSTKEPIQKDELDRIRSAEASLVSENSKLRQQLQRWRGAAAGVAEREAKAAELLSKSKRSQQEPASLLSVFVADKAAGGGSEINVLRLIFFILCFNAACFVLWRTAETLRAQSSSSKAKYDWASLKASAGRQKSAAMSFIEPILRFAGYGPIEVQASQIQVANLPDGGDIFVTIQLGGSNEVRTEVAERSSSGLIRFQERLRFTIPGNIVNSQKCIVRIANADLPGQDTVAYVEVTAKDLLHAVRSKRGQQFFTYNLISKEHSFDGMRPQLAMKLSNVRTRQEQASSYGSV
eukprot:TRINITY_DN108997_c0_g1_i1.p1 TRINITY_DN108997_c0_g1~~TRINITY_DN108997_c0_g1_i1.p1  ORF type:complete len:389 (-),score=72.04 TRINITY_DN108997_c0_g1_i1:91-1257(-)